MCHNLLQSSKSQWAETRLELFERFSSLIKTNTTMHRVFTYGTLKTGQPNHYFMTEQVQKFLSFSEHHPIINSCLMQNYLLPKNGCPSLVPLKAHSHCAFFLIATVIPLITTNRWVAQDSMEVLILCNCDNIHHQLLYSPLRAKTNRCRKSHSVNEP